MKLMLRRFTYIDDQQHERRSQARLAHRVAADQLHGQSAPLVRSQPGLEGVGNDACSKLAHHRGGGLMIDTEDDDDEDDAFDRTMMILKV